MYALFEAEFGVRMVRAEEKIRAVLPDAEQARCWKSPRSTPLLSVERMAFTYNDAPMELRRGLYRTDTHHYRNDWAEALPRPACRSAVHPRMRRMMQIVRALDALQ